MPFTRKSLSALRDECRADLGVAAKLRFSVERIIADILAAMGNAAFGYLDYIAKQAVPFTATGEYAEAWAAFKDISRKPAAAAAGSATFIGTDGMVLPIATPLVRDDGFGYVTTAEGVVDGGVVTVPFVAVSPGAAGNADDGAALTLGTAIAGLDSTGEASGAVTGGADVELDDALKERYLAAFAAPPQGGAETDYPGWAKQVPGVTRAGARGLGMGAGTVVVYFMMDEAQAENDGFPQGTSGVASAEDRDTPASGDQLEVADHIYGPGRQPVTALVYAVAPAKNTVSMTISLPGATTATKADMADAIRDVFFRSGDPRGAPYDVDMSEVQSAVAALPPAAGFVITDVDCDHGTVNPSNGNIVSDIGRLPFLGVVTWI